ncbi:MAG TPA: hypothetical protein VK173_05505, partial [Lacibacter sp.]|nr:hypothetical protein [Lacibacter sp.]
DYIYKAGFEHYEISNFAKPGYRSKHNSSYWKGVHYLGLGPSAHSFNGNSRQWNVANNQLYIQSLKQGTLSFEKEELTATQQLNEYIMTGLRLMEGCDLNYISQQFGSEKSVELSSNAAAPISKGLMIAQNNHLILTRDGKLFADSIAADLFF